MLEKIEEARMQTARVEQPTVDRRERGKDQDPAASYGAKLEIYSKQFGES